MKSEEADLYRRVICRILVVLSDQVTDQERLRRIAKLCNAAILDHVVLTREDIGENHDE